jgi:hypothetical protein
MNQILLKRLNANSTALEECESFFSKYIKAWNISHNLDRSSYEARHVRIFAGPHEQIDNIMTFDIGDTQYSFIDKPSKNKRGTLKAGLKYSSRPVTLETAFKDLSRSWKETGIQFGVNLNSSMDTKIFKGKWDISSSSNEPWNEFRINQMLDLVNSDVTSMKIQFVGILDNAEIASLSDLVDELYLPDYTGYKITSEFHLTYRNSEYTTKTKYRDIKSNMPMIVAHKRIYGFDEQKISEFFNKIKSFEKIDFLRPINEFWAWPHPIINIEVASLVNGRPMYVSYQKIESRPEYIETAQYNRRKDLVKEKLKNNPVDKYS